MDTQADTGVCLSHVAKLEFTVSKLKRVTIAHQRNVMRLAFTDRPKAAQDFMLAGVGRGGGYSHIFFIRRLGSSIYRLPPKNMKNFKHPQKIFEIATPKISPILYLDLKKRP